MGHKDWKQIKEHTYSDKIFRYQMDEYKKIRFKRNNNVHEKHVSISKEEAENFAFIGITFIYSITLKKNKFKKPWVRGTE
jgi:hypothetical protein